MPAAALKTCGRAGCPVLAVFPARYCGRHAKARQREVDARRGTASQRGYDAKWRRVRAAYLRAHPLCKHCLKRGLFEPAVEVDHIHGFDGLDDPARFDWANLQGLCKPDHSRKTVRENGGFGNARAMEAAR